MAQKENGQVRILGPQPLVEQVEIIYHPVKAVVWGEIAQYTGPFTGMTVTLWSLATTMIPCSLQARANLA